MDKKLGQLLKENEQDPLQGEEAPQGASEWFARQQESRRRIPSPKNILTYFKRHRDERKQTKIEAEEQKRAEARKNEARDAVLEKERKLEELRNKIIDEALSPVRAHYKNIETKILGRKKKGYDFVPDDISDLNKVFFNTGGLGSGFDRRQYDADEKQAYNLPDTTDILLNSDTLQKSPYIDTLVEIAFRGKGSQSIDEYAKAKGLNREEVEKDIDLEIARLVVQEYVDLKNSILGAYVLVAVQPPPPRSREKIEVKD